MKTRQKRRRTLKKHCLCNCEETIKSPEISNNNNKKKKRGRSSLKVNEKSIIIQKTTKKTNKKGGSIKKQIKNDTSLVTALKKSPSPSIQKTNHNNGKILIKEPYVLLTRLNIKSPTMKLRKNRQKNYCEPPSLHDESTNEKSIEKPMEKPAEKIPIYKQQIEEDTNKTKKKKKKNEIDDLYEFESDSEETKHKRPRKRKLNDSSHDEYNKTIENILKNVALKIKVRKHNPDKKTTDINTNNDRNNNDEKGKRTRVNQMNVNEEEMSEETQIKEMKSEKIDNPESPRKKTTNSNTNNNDKGKRRRVNRRNLNEEPVFKKTEIIEDKIEKVNNQKSSTSSKPSPNSTQHVEKSSEINQDSFTSSSKLAFNDNDETFGFLDDNEDVSEIPTDEQTNRTPKINIISNIKLKPHQKWIFTKNPTQSPNANSTMIYNVLTPWRFNEINIRRNPHLIHVKKSALPCITQEPVLEYSIIEKLANSSTPHHNGGDNDNKDKQNSISQTPILRRSPRKYATPTIQKTLDDYYGDNSENKENRHVITRYSLFDADELSPIKANEDKRSPLAKINSIKRQILADFNENTKENSQISTINLNKIEDNHNSNEVKTYFGFETSKESEDNSNIDNDKVNKDDRPYRLSISTNDKKYEAKKKRAHIEVYDNKEANEDPPNKVINDYDAEDSDDDDGKSDAESVDGGGLFEDFHDDNEKKENMTIKKRKVKWMLTDDDEKPRRRRKDVRTKKEEEAAERWAEQFNSMCKEVEDFPLEIE